ncbi:unnamed protein product, partial [Prorocentrum cordatum]
GERRAGAVTRANAAAGAAGLAGAWCFAAPAPPSPLPPPGPFRALILFLLAPIVARCYGRTLGFPRRPLDAVLLWLTDLAGGEVDPLAASEEESSDNARHGRA